MTGEREARVPLFPQGGPPEGPPSGAVKRVVSYRVLVTVLTKAVLQLAESGTVDNEVFTQLKESLHATKRR